MAESSHDRARRRRGKRSQRERGCWVYIPAVDLTAAGVDPNGPAPYYRTWGDRRGGVVVRLYDRP
jgi:hypothetical protein